MHQALCGGIVVSVSPGFSSPVVLRPIRCCGALKTAALPPPFFSKPSSTASMFNVKDTAVLADASRGVLLSTTAVVTGSLMKDTWRAALRGGQGVLCFTFPPRLL